MDDAGNALGMDENPETEKSAGAAELMTPDNAPGPEDNDADDEEPGNGLSVGNLGGNPNDGRMKGEQPYSTASNFGEGGTAGDVGQSDTGAN